MTLVKDHNMGNFDEYAKLIEKANPTFVEAKAYMHIGFSNLRLSFERMPMHFEVKDFATQLAEKTGYNVIDEAPESRVVLLSKLKKPIQVATSSRVCCAFSSFIVDSILWLVLLQFFLKKHNQKTSVVLLAG